MSWELITTPSGAPRPRRAHAACVVGNQMLTFGGRGAVSGKGPQPTTYATEIFDLSTRAWTHPMGVVSPGERWNHSLTPVGSDVYLFGGEDEVKLRPDIFVFSMETLEWTELTAAIHQPLPERYAHSCVAYNNVLWVFGGATTCHVNDTHTYNTKTGEWQVPEITGTLPSPRCGHAATVFRDEMWVFGGLSTDFVNDLFVLDLVGGVWREVAAGGVPPSPRGHLSATVLPSLGIVFFGGWAQQEKPHQQTLLMNDTHLLKVGHHNVEWSRPVLYGTAPPPRNTHVAVGVGTGVYIFGGWDRKVCFNDIFKLDMSVLLEGERQGALSQSLRKSLFGDKLFADVVIVSGGVELPAHRCILASTCHYFHDLFTSPMADSSSGVIEAPFLLNNEQPSPETLRTFIHLLYGAPLPQCPIACTHLLPLADYYRSDMLTSSLQGTILSNLTPANVAEIATAADTYGHPDLLDSCIYFTVGNYKEALPTLKVLPSHLKDRVMQGIIPKMAK